MTITPPILAVTDAHVDVSVTVPDPDRVSDQDLACARRLAEAVARYVTELEKFSATDRESAAGLGAAGGDKAAERVA